MYKICTYILYKVNLNSDVFKCIIKKKALKIIKKSLTLYIYNGIIFLNIYAYIKIIITLDKNSCKYVIVSCSF